MNSGFATHTGYQPSSYAMADTRKGRRNDDAKMPSREISANDNRREDGQKAAAANQSSPSSPPLAKRRHQGDRERSPHKPEFPSPSKLIKQNPGAPQETMSHGQQTEGGNAFHPLVTPFPFCNNGFLSRYS